jgi:hypothetical protein
MCDNIYYRMDRMMNNICLSISFSVLHLISGINDDVIKSLYLQIYLKASCVAKINADLYVPAKIFKAPTFLLNS